MMQLGCRGPVARVDLWSVVALVLGSLAAFAAENPAPTVGTCPPDQLQKVTLENGSSVLAPGGFDRLAFYDSATGKSLKDLSPLLKNNTWTVQAEHLKFAEIPYKDVEKVSLAWAKLSLGEKSPLCLQPIQVIANTAVTTVVCGANQSACYVGLGDYIWIGVQDLNEWIKNHSVAQGRATPQTAIDLVPFFDGVPVRGIRAENPGTQPEEMTTDFHSYHTLRFKLERNTSNRDVWNRFLRGLKWNGRLLDVSVGFDGGDPMPTFVQKDKPPSDDPSYQSYKTFTLVVLPHSSTVVAAVLF